MAWMFELCRGEWAQLGPVSKRGTGGVLGRLWLIVLAVIL